MPLYHAYGLSISASLQLPELITAVGKPDVTITTGGLPAVPEAFRGQPHAAWLSQDGLYLYWDGVGTFLVSEGTRIIIDPQEAAEESRLRLFLLGAAFGALLLQRGIFTLHASAVAIDGHAVAFIGNKGWGKSTLANTMVERGHELLADDVLAVQWSPEGKPYAIPAFPQLKLWPDALEHFGHTPSDLLRISSLIEKRERREQVNLAQEAKPLAAIVLLARGEDLQLHPLEPQDALTNLLTHAYCTRFASTLLTGQNAAWHFQQCAKAVSQVPCLLLQRPPSLPGLAQTAEMIEATIRELGTP